MAQHRTIYHSSVKLAFSLELEHEWLPQEFLATIPRSTSHGWKDLQKGNFAGAEYAEKINGKVEDLRLLYHKNAQTETKIFKAYLRLKITIIKMLGEEQVKQALKENYRGVVQAVENTKNSFKGGVKTVCSYLDIKPRVYYYWRSIAKHKCTESMQEICVKKVPSQASSKEITIMKSMLTRSRFMGWAICSVWGYARRNYHTQLGLQSWYKYNQRYKFRIKPKKGIFKAKYNPLRASRPNEIWHADVTIFRTLDEVKHYIYLIVDNFSRHIINWKISTECNGAIRTETLREAVIQEFGEDALSGTLSEEDIRKKPTLDLIVDGGSENNNKTVEEFIKDAQVNMTKYIALTDVKQSNAMVEATNKTLKYSYLFPKELANGEALEKHLELSIYDFCECRPNFQHSIYTPHEMHYNLKPSFTFPTTQETIKERCSYHKMLSCSENCC